MSGPVPLLRSGSPARSRPAGTALTVPATAGDALIAAAVPIRHAVIGAPS